MKTFRDSTGREWAVIINVAAIKRVRDLLKIDLLALVDDGFKGLGELLADPVQLVDVLYVLCKPEADSRNVSDEAFGAAMAGDALDAAATAFLDEYVDFFPAPRRAALQKVIAAGRAMEAKATALAMAKLNALDLDSEVQKFIDSSNGAPASSDATPTPSPSDNSPSAPRPESVSPGITPPI